jgi:hypothetical protein
MFKTISSLLKDHSLQIFLAVFLLSTLLQALFFAHNPALWLCYTSMLISHCFACVARAEYVIDQLRIRVERAVDGDGSGGGSTSSSSSVVTGDSPTGSITPVTSPETSVHTDAYTQTPDAESEYTFSWEDVMTEFQYTIGEQAEMLVSLREILPVGVSLRSDVMPRSVKVRVILALARGGREAGEEVRELVREVYGDEGVL